MALNCFSSNHSSSLPNISSVSTTKSYFKVSNSVTLTAQKPCSNSNLNMVQESALAMSHAVKVLESTLNSGHGGKDVQMNRCSGVAGRRKRRRRKRRALQFLDDEEDDKHAFVNADNKGRKRLYLTPKEEAKFSWYLKERARIEAVRKRFSDTGMDDLASRQWANAAGISQQSLEKILLNGRESQEKLTSCYRRLVISVAASYQGKGLSLQDLIQEGSIGLLRGAIRFDPQRGNKLSTYAYWWIRQAITRAIANKSRIIRLPGSMNELMPKICKASTALSRSLRRFPTYDEIAEDVGVESSLVRLVLERNRSPIPLDEAITSQGRMSLQDIIAGPDEITPEALVKKESLRRGIQELLCGLCEREASVLRLHYGLNGDTPWSFEEIGRSFKLSRERVRQINCSALSKLQQTVGIHYLKYLL